MKRGVWHELARQLASQGVPVTEIAERVGVGYSAVWKILNPERTREWSRRDNAKPERKAAKRAADDAARATCPECGGKCGQASKWHCVERCRSCEDQRRSESAAVQAETFVRLWAEGKTLREICSHFGWPDDPHYAGAWCARYRERGYDLPHRRSGQALENIRAGNAAIRERNATERLAA